MQRRLGMPGSERHGARPRHRPGDGSGRGRRLEHRARLRMRAGALSVGAVGQPPTAPNQPRLTMSVMVRTIIVPSQKNAMPTVIGEWAANAEGPTRGGYVNQQLEFLIGIDIGLVGYSD